MPTISSNLNFPTSKQVPNEAIMDMFGKQSYLGNQYVYPGAAAGITLGSSSEISIALIVNDSANPKSLFVNSRKLISTDSVVARFYFDTVVGAQIQTVGMVADTAGSLNSKYFLLQDGAGNKFYVWFNINSAGVDPLIAGRTAIPVTGATNASAATLGAAMAIAIAAINSTNSFTTSGTSTVTITNKVAGVSVIATDGAAPTGFAFTLTRGYGSNVSTGVVNMRPANDNTSVATVYLSPIVQTKGTLAGLLASTSALQSDTQNLIILDPGQSLLITAQSSASSPIVYIDTSWYEL